MLKTSLAAVAALLIVAVVGVVALVFYQGRKAPEGDPQYVALGSSFAAGMGLGRRDPGSPFICMRTINGYPEQLARLNDLSLVDVTCSGATAKNVLSGGRAFLAPQINALALNTELVTLTMGGNDVDYVGDLTFLSARGRSSLLGWYSRAVWKGPAKPGDRDWEQLRRDFSETLREIRRRAPRAQIVVATYPTLLPPAGTCADIGLNENDALAMRAVGDRLAEITKTVAVDYNAIVVDMNDIAAEHHACSSQPWVHGGDPESGMPFHPNIAGSQATAWAIAEAVGKIVGR